MCVQALVEGEQGLAVVAEIVRISQAGRAPKQSPGTHHMLCLIYNSALGYNITLITIKTGAWFSVTRIRSVG